MTKPDESPAPKPAASKPAGPKPVVPAAGGPPAKTPAQAGETGGPAWPEPTRYGDWERAGRVSDF